MDIGFPAERTHFSRRPYNSRSHFRPQSCGHEFYGHEDFPEKGPGDSLRDALLLLRLPLRKDPEDSGGLKGGHLKEGGHVKMRFALRIF